MNPLNPEIKNQTEALLQIDPFNDNSLQAASSNGYSETNSSCTDSCKTNNNPPAFEHRNDSIQAAGDNLQEMGIKLTYLETELNLMKLRFGSIEIQS